MFFSTTGSHTPVKTGGVSKKAEVTRTDLLPQFLKKDTKTTSLENNSERALHRNYDSVGCWHLSYWCGCLLSSELWPQPRCSQQMQGKPSPVSMSRPWKLSSTWLSFTPRIPWPCPMPWTMVTSCFTVSSLKQNALAYYAHISKPSAIFVPTQSLSTSRLMTRG